MDIRMKVSNLLDPKRRDYILIILEVDLFLLLFLTAVGHSAINNQLLLYIELLRFFFLNNIIITLSLLSMFGRYSRYGYPVVNLITLCLSSIDSLFLFFFFNTSIRDTSCSFIAIFLLLSGLFRSIYSISSHWLRLLSFTSIAPMVFFAELSSTLIVDLLFLYLSLITSSSSSS